MEQLTNVNLCKRCGSVLLPDAKFCGKCGASLDFDLLEINSDIVSVDKPKKMKKKVVVVAMFIFIVTTIITFIVGSATYWFGLTAPFTKIYRATVKTLQADSFSMKMSIKVSNSDSKTSDIYNDEAVAKVVVDDKDEKVDVLIEDSNTVRLFTDNTMYYYSVDGNAVSIEEKASNKEFFEFKDKFRSDDVDYDDIVELLGLEEHLNGQEIKKLIKGSTKKFFSNKKWMENTMGYSKNRNKMIFSPDLYCMFSDFSDFIDDSDVLSKGDKDIVTNKLESIISDKEKMENLDIEVTIALKKGYINAITIKVSNSSKAVYTIELELYDMNNTEIEDEKISDIKSEAEKLKKARVCAACENEFLILFDRDSSGNYYCSDCYTKVFNYTYGECDWCLRYGKVYDYDSDYKHYHVCADCYDLEEGYCEICNGIKADWYYGGKNLCYDCYSDWKQFDEYSDDYGECDRCGKYDELGEYEYQLLCYECLSIY